ncbi:MAG: family 10 glycosylhydrolase [Ignavibacteriales bacterium]|nr:family 10 glycosylhydrolase [Ignavibacteriales bacterium]
MKRILLYGCAATLFLSLHLQAGDELRGVWLTNVDSNVLSSDQAIIDGMDYLASIGVNVVFPVVYNKGYTLYPSAVMNDRFGVPVLPSSPFVGRDFLKRMVIEAHRNGIEVIPWFEFGFSTSYSLEGGHIIAKYPAWALKTREGALVVDNGFDWMSAINPEAQRYVTSLLTEVMDNYDVDGVQGDDRLPAMPVEGGYDSVTTAIYKAEHAGQVPPFNYNDAAWMQWRADKLTQYLAGLRDSVKARGPNMILSVAPTPYNWGYAQLLQDSKKWMQQGLVDNLIPQLYQYSFSEYSYALNLSWADIGQVNPSAYAAGVLARVGTYVVDTAFLGQMLSANRTKGVKGECLFFYEGLRANSDRVGLYLKNRFYQNSARLPYRNGKLWRPKAQIQNETDAGAKAAGDWQTYLMKGYQGSIVRTGDTVNAAVFSYTNTIAVSAYYDVYAYMTPNTPWTKRAVYTLYSGNDSSKFIIDQSDLAKKGWQKIGTMYHDAGVRTVLKVDNSQLEPGRYLVTDAIMVMINRNLSPNAIVSVTPGSDEPAVVPDKCSLQENYPNPFNPSTTLTYSIDRSRHVNLSVHDVLGRTVARLVDRDVPAGNYTVRFDASALSSGAYFCILTAGPFVQLRKMLLLK